MDNPSSVETSITPSPTSTLPFPFNAFSKPTLPSEVRPTPTETQTARLAVVLSHEISHLLLSHSLEGLTATDFYFLLGNLSTDRKHIKSSHGIQEPFTHFLSQS